MHLYWCRYEDGNIYHTIEGAASAIISYLRVPSLQEVEDVMLRAGAKHVPGVGYAYLTEEEAAKGLEKLVEIIESEMVVTCPEGHVIDERKFEPGEGAYCEECKDDLGWFCAGNSPVLICEYNEEKDPCCDSCIHCGEPLERY